MTGKQKEVKKTIGKIKEIRENIKEKEKQNQGENQRK